MLMAKNPRIPFPSFALALSRLEADDNNESTNNGIQETNASNVEPPIDLMKTFDPRLPRYESISWKMRNTTDEDRSDTETVFEERIDTVAASKGSIKGSRKRNRGLSNHLSEIFRMLKCFTR